jgi:hypothetical protein
MRGYRYKHGDRPLPGYTIQRAAGRGGFGEVYYALSDSGREVALKVVHAYEEIELRGISQCMNLKSPHLVSIFDVRHADDGQPVVIMEYITGPSLREILDEAPSGLGTQKAAFFLREIGKGLTYLHDCGIVHRDLKPANIFYENGYVKIVDYGLSKVMSASHRSAQTVTVGTLHYMAPEVGGGQYDRSVDIYALGALLYEMLTGQPPFFGISPAEVLMKHLSTQVNVEGIEEPFATVIKKALAKDPAQRYQTVQEMVEAVYGTEHVRNSVSCFSPADLTVVAGRVAHRAGVQPGRAPHTPAPLSSRAFDVAAPATPAGLAGRLGDAARLMTDRVRTLFGPFACPDGGFADRRPQRRQKRRERWAQWMGQPVAPPAPTPAPAAPPTDPLSTAHRTILALVAAVAVAVAAGAFSDYAYPFLVSAFALAGTIGATIGLRLATAKVLPAMDRESKFLQHLAAGGIAAVFMLVAALPAWVTAANIRNPSRGVAYNGTSTGIMLPGHSLHVAGTLAAICVSLLLVDWGKRTTTGRPQRVSLGHLVSAGIAAAITSSILGAAPEVVIAVLCGACLAVQINSPWHPTGAQAQGLPSPGLPPIPHTPHAPHPAPNRDVARPIPAQLAPYEPISVYDVARRSVAVGKAAVVWPVRAALFVLAHALLVATFLLAFGLAFDLPGFVASGRLDPTLPRDIQRSMGVENWPLVWRSIGVGAMFTAACLAVTLLMLLRRSGGGLHMVRVVAGAALVICVPFMAAGKVFDWGPLTTGQRPNGWEIWQALTHNISPAIAIKSAALGITGVLLLLWPAKRAHPSPAQGPVSGRTEGAASPPAH